MKKTKSYIIISGSPAFSKRFSRWLKNRYNVSFPIREVRFEKLGMITTTWEIDYHDNFFNGSSESRLNAIAQAAEREHLNHVHNSYETTISWDIYSE